MSKNFLIYASETVPVPENLEIAEEKIPQREPLRMLVIGSRRGVTGTIQTLHRLRYAEVREWSPLMPGPNPGEVMSILTRYLVSE
jgi:hypothetical protein